MGNKVKVVFFDVDGVLNSDKYFDKTKELKIEGIQSEIELEKVFLLRKAISETGARAVNCSSWRMNKNGFELRKLLGQCGIFADLTPFIGNERGLEIKKYIVDRGDDVEDFLILDDEICSSYDDILLGRLIKIGTKNGREYGEGLQEKDVEEIVKRLGKIKSMER